jgi:hypothetical protein
MLEHGLLLSNEGGVIEGTRVVEGSCTLLWAAHAWCHADVSWALLLQSIGAAASECEEGGVINYAHGTTAAPALLPITTHRTHAEGGRGEDMSPDLDAVDRERERHMLHFGCDALI